MKNYKIIQLTLLLFFTGSLCAQPVVLNPLVSTEIAAGPGLNNTGSDIARVLVGGVPTDINVMVAEVAGGGGLILRAQFPGTINFYTLNLGVGFPLGTIITDPDVVAVVSSTSGLGNLKERVLITYIVHVPGSTPHVYLQMCHWDASIPNFVISALRMNLTINPFTGVCATPNIDADYLGNYAVVWEESNTIYLASDNALTSWGTAPSKFVNFSASCGLFGDENEPDVCLMPGGGAGTTASLINVAFRRTFTIYLERMLTTQLVAGLIPFPSSNCTTLAMVDTFSLAGSFLPPSDIRIACPPTMNASRGLHDMTIAFTDHPVSASSSDILTITHHQNSLGLGWYAGLNVNANSGSPFAPTGPNYVNAKPAVAYKLNSNQFVVGWEFNDSFNITSNAYEALVGRIATNAKHIIAQRLGDNNIPLNINASELSYDDTGLFSDRDAVSISRGNNSPMRYTYSGSGNFLGYNSLFPVGSLKKEREVDYLFLVGPASTTGIASMEENSEIKVFPNPANKSDGKIKVVLSDDLVSTIEIYSIAGTLIHSETTEDVKELTIYNNYESGTYLIHVKNEKQHYIRKLVVN